jgi:hypothetical protein
MKKFGTLLALVFAVAMMAGVVYGLTEEQERERQDELQRQNAILKEDQRPIREGKLQGSYTPTDEEREEEWQKKKQTIIEQQGEAVKRHRVELKQYEGKTVVAKTGFLALANDDAIALNALRYIALKDHDSLNTANMLKQFRVFEAGEPFIVIGSWKAEDTDGMSVLFIHVKSLRHPTDILGRDVAYFVESNGFFEAF